MLPDSKLDADNPRVARPVLPQVPMLRRIQQTMMLLLVLLASGGGLLFYHDHNSGDLQLRHQLEAQNQQLQKDLDTQKSGRRS